jgi:hypothetical protein
MSLPTRVSSAAAHEASGAGTQGRNAPTSRRRTVRHRPVRSGAALEILEESGDSIPFDQWKLSPFGAWLHSDMLYSIGDRLMLRISLPHIGPPLRVEGEVIRTEIGETGQSPGMGIAFRNLRPADRQMLRGWVFHRFLEMEGS